MTNIILCGGSGTRLWPVSRALMPKQFVEIFGGKSLFQYTVERNNSLCDNTFVVSNAEQYFLAYDQLENLGVDGSKFLLEPVGRNTAPAIALACFALQSDTVVLVTPSDHVIKNQKNYEEALKRAKTLAEQDYLVTFGITPNAPETGFGYIESEVLSDKCEVVSGLDVVSFKEKPDLKTATGYIDKNLALSTENLPLQYYWNSGMFCFKAGVFLDELKTYSPKIYEASKKAYDNAKIDEMIRITHDDMTEIPEDSIDYAVMEQSKKVKVVPSDIDWSDLGSFDALADEFEKDKNGNTIDDSNILIDAKNNLVVSEEAKVITAIGVEDLIIVDTADALLVTKKGQSQKVKQAVAEIKKRGLELHNIHKTAHRPWGTYTVLEDTDGYKIKRIVVKPGKRLSLQKHYHRNEHWIVVSGTATVTVGEETKLVRPNESTYIKMGEVHRLANEGTIPVVLIEAQVGEYTGEDDIIRLDDDFKRD